MAPRTSRLDLHEALRRKAYDFGVVTTYGFSPAFFESYCLDRLTALADNPNLTIVTDAPTYDALVAERPEDRPKRANLQYFLLPVSAPGVFHAKLALFGTKNHGRLIVTSANLTQSSLTLNAELASVFDTEVDADETYQPLFAAAFEFLQRLLHLAPSDTFESALQLIAREARWLHSPSPAVPTLPVRFVHNLDAPLLHTIARFVGDETGTIWILSPTFDEQPTLLTRLHDLLSPKAIRIFTDNRHGGLGPTWLQHPLVKNGRAQFLACRYSDEGQPQPLHAKAIILKTKAEFILVVGSANFTTPALAAPAAFGNVEVALVYRLPFNALDPDRFCDPSKSAAPLTTFTVDSSPEPPMPPKPPSTKPTILLREAILTDERLVATAAVPGFQDLTRLVACLSFSDGKATEIALELVRADRYGADVPPDVVPKVNHASTVAHLIAYKGGARVAESNPLFLTNLLDIHSGQSVRRARQLRAAQEGTAQFFEVLRDLLGTDDEALRVFLTLCDIPVTDAPAPPAHAGRPAIDLDGMRTLGERNLTIFASLHDAAVHFIDKHLRRLSRHVEHGELTGVRNFTHIALAIGGVIVAQITRITAGLEAIRAPMSASDWFDYRDRCGRYVQRFQVLSSRIAVEYLPAMLQRHTRAQLAERLTDDLPIFRNLFDRFLGIRNALEELRRAQLRVSVDRQGELTAPWNDRVDLFSEARWPSFAQQLTRQLGNLEGVVSPRRTTATGPVIDAGLPG